MQKSISLFLILGITLLLQTGTARAQYVISEGDAEGAIKSRSIVVPYAFSSETLGFGLGLGGSYTPESQPQSTYYSTLYGTDNGSWLGLLGGYNLQLPTLERLYIRPYGIFARNTMMRIYLDGTPDLFPNEKAGSNESSPDNYIEEDAQDTTLDLELRYILPWGHFRDNPVHTYITQNGILKENPSGATSINPLESGQTVVVFEPYYRKIYTDAQQGETLYFKLGAEYDNRDYIPNPHRGYKLKAGISHDFDWLSDTKHWTSLDGEINGFIPLWDTSWSRQQTLALSWWSAYSPSYDTSSSATGQGKPPYFTGPTLGGLYRLRAYPAYRFHDKAAIYYGAEYRVMPEWQPFGSIDLLDPLDIRWWEIVGLMEVGRVAPAYHLQTLHTDMKYDIGIGVRGMFYTGIGRLDFAVSEEGFSMVAMFGQTF